MSFRPALVDPQGGPTTGKEGGPMSLAKPAINWSHVTGKRTQTFDFVRFGICPLTWTFIGAPGKIRTCAHGLGNRCSIP
jgi:hypothetical protein